MLNTLFYCRHQIRVLNSGFQTSTTFFPKRHVLLCTLHKDLLSTLLFSNAWATKNEERFKKTEIAKGVLVFRLFIQYYHLRLYYGMECVTFNLNSSVYPVTTVLN